MLTIKRDELTVEKLEERMLTDTFEREINSALEEIIHQAEQDYEDRVSNEPKKTAPSNQTMYFSETDPGTSYTQSSNYFTTPQSTTNPYYEELKNETYQTTKSTDEGIHIQQITEEVSTKIINAQFGVYYEFGKLVCEEKKRSDPTYIANFTLHMLMYDWMQHVI